MPELTARQRLIIVAASLAVGLAFLALVLSLGRTQMTGPLYGALLRSRASMIRVQST